jgi:Pentapeptide repeats (8 copies)
MRIAFLNGTTREVRLEPGANLRGAYLHGAYLHGADLRGADLSSADLPLDPNMYVPERIATSRRIGTGFKEAKELPLP